MSSTSDADLFGFDDPSVWLAHLREAERHESLGSMGSFELIEEVGRGGQGVVFRARQSGTGREVAIKRLLAGSDATQAQRRRFEREIEAATALRHPGLVTVFSSEMVGGLPVFAMEWVEGKPITEWAAALPKTSAERRRLLEVFVRLCEAVRHAHQRGVLHRDLKPSNVLVDGQDQPRVLDFGLVKFLDERATGEVSHSSERIGTPAYAAPEQLLGAAAEVDARSDVYSLGAILFEMLTGRRLVEGTGLEILAQALQRRPPPRPSSWDHSIGSELDAIVLQATANDRERRYQSVDALAADVRRHLSGDAVLARGPSNWYLLRKLIARNRTVAGLLALLLAASLGFTLFALNQAERLATESRQASLQARAADDARTEAERQATSAREAETLARQETRKARDVLDFLVEDVMQATSPRTAGHEPTVEEVLSFAAERIAMRFGGSPSVEAEVRGLVARSFYSLGRHERAAQVIRPALELHRGSGDLARLGTAEAFLGSSLLQIGDSKEARSLLESAIQHLENASSPAPESLAFALAGLGDLFVRAAQPASAIPLFERALAIGTEPQAPRNMQGLAWCYYMSGQLEKSRTLHEEALALEREHNPEDTWLSAKLISGLGTIAITQKNVPEAVARSREALRIFEKRLGAEHPHVAIELRNLAKALAAAQEYEEAERMALKSLDLARRGARCSLPQHLEVLGGIYLNTGRHEDSESALREAVDIATECLGPDYNERLVYAAGHAEALIFLGEFEEAREILEDAAERLRRNYGPQAMNLGNNLFLQGQIAHETGDDARAVQLWEEAFTLDMATGLTFNAAYMLKLIEGVHLHHGDTEAAEQVRHRYEELRPSMPPNSYDYLESLFPK